MVPSAPLAWQVRIPASTRAQHLPPADDPRVVKLEEARAIQASKLRDVVDYMGAGVPAGCDESEVLWARIAAYFGE